MKVQRLSHLILEGVIFLPSKVILRQASRTLCREEIERRVAVAAVRQVLDAIRMIQLRHAIGLEYILIGLARHIGNHIESCLTVYIAEHHPSLRRRVAHSKLITLAPEQARFFVGCREIKGIFACIESHLLVEMLLMAQHGFVMVARIIDDLPLVVVSIEVSNVVAHRRVEVEHIVDKY